MTDKSSLFTIYFRMQTSFLSVVFRTFFLIYALHFYALHFYTLQQ